MIAEGTAINTPQELLNYKDSLYKRKEPMKDKAFGCFIGSLNLLYALLGITGLFTVNWFLFIILVIMGFIPEKTVTGIRIDGIISFIIIILIILNKTQFHYRFPQLLHILHIL